MIKAALILAASASALGLATLSLAQEATDERFMPVSGSDRNWYLQRSTCTLAHNVNGDSAAVVRLRIVMGVELDFVDPALRGVRQSDAAEFVVAVDGVNEGSFGMGIDEGDRWGYALSVSHELLDRMSTGRRLEARSGGRTLLRLDLTGAAAAIDAMRACHREYNLANAMAEEPVNESDMDMGMDMNMSDANWGHMTDMNYTNSTDAMDIPNAM